VNIALERAEGKIGDYRKLQWMMANQVLRRVVNGAALAAFEKEGSQWPIKLDHPA